LVNDFSLFEFISGIKRNNVYGHLIHIMVHIQVCWKKVMWKCSVTLSMSSAYFTQNKCIS